MSGRPRATLAELAARASSCRDPAELRRLAADLVWDPRAGVRGLAGRLLRRARRLEAERERVEALYAGVRRLRRRGFARVAGVDEVGMGPLAGPVVAAAVVLPDDLELPGLDDSKRLSAAERERLAREIRARALALSVAAASHREIDRLDIRRAGLVAMRRAVEALRPRPDHVLVDARELPDLGIPQTPVVRGDAREAPIAAASIVAKVHRDALMRRLDRRHPGYGFARHMGYPTPEHLEALARLGPSPVHRRSFGPVARVLASR